MRLLMMDGTPGAAALLVLATQGALPGFDAVLIPETGAYPAGVYRYLDRLARIAAEAATQVLWVDAGASSTTDRSGAHPGGLPLYTRSAEGARGRGAKQGELACPATACFPLVELGWTSTDCRAYLHHHDIAHPPDMACTPCPNRANASWAELRATNPQAWHRAVALDAALRHDPSSAAPHGMPPDATGYLHPDRVPLDQVDLDAERGHPGRAVRAVGLPRHPGHPRQRRGWCRVIATRAPTAPCPLPLYIRGPEGTTGQLAGGRAEQQAAAIDAALRYLLGYPHPAPVPKRIIAESVLGLDAEYAHLAHPAQVPPYRRNVYQLVEMGWRTADCRRRLAMHDLAYVPDVACGACPNRGNAAWVELEGTDLQAWQEAVATGATLRNDPTTAVPGGMPPGTAASLHPDCVPLSWVEHGIDTGPEPGGYSPWTCSCAGWEARTETRDPRDPAVTVRFLTGCRFQAAVRTNTDLAPR